MAYKLTQEEREFLLSIMPKIKKRARTKVRAINNGANCAYRADGEAGNTKPNNCCFIGVLIPPDNYHKSLELCLGDEDAVIYAIGYMSKPSRAFRQVMSEIQAVHDIEKCPDWSKQLRIIEKEIKG